jgi:integration host factor subunit beta
MNRSEIVDIISRRESVDGHTVDAVLRGFVDLLIINLSAGEPVTIRGLGRFDRKVRPNANLRHPRTGALIETGERRTVGFRPSMQLKERLNPLPLPAGTDP